MEYDAQYAATPDLFGAEPEPTLVRFAHLIEGPGNVLDVGCGQGRNSVWLARQGHQVVALDPSAQAVAAVSSAVSGLPVTIVHGSFETIPEDLAPFAAVCVFGLLQILTVEQRLALLRSIEEWSRPGSLLFLTAWTSDDPEFPRISSTWQEVGELSYRSQDGRVRSYLRPGAATGLLPNWELLHHHEGLGPWHRHGDSPLQRHGILELVVRRREPARRAD